MKDADDLDALVSELNAGESRNGPSDGQEITITRKQGSFTLEESLTDLVKQGVIDRKDALTRAMHPEELERLLA